MTPSKSLAAAFTAAAFSSLMTVSPLAAQELSHATTTQTTEFLLAAATPQAEVQRAMRGLWAGHANTVYDVAKALVAGDQAAADKAEAAVVANAKAIAGAIEPFYGAEASDALFKLLAGHYGAVKNYFIAAIAKDEDKKNAAIAELNSNAEQIAVFLSTANPNLPKDDVLGLLQAHAGHHITQVQQLIAGDKAGADETLNMMIEHLNGLSDALTNALAKQFPDKIKA